MNIKQTQYNNCYLEVFCVEGSKKSQMLLYNHNSPDVGMAVGEPDICRLKFC